MTANRWPPAGGGAELGTLGAVLGGAVRTISAVWVRTSGAMIPGGGAVVVLACASSLVRISGTGGAAALGSSPSAVARRTTAPTNATTIAKVAALSTTTTLSRRASRRCLAGFRVTGPPFGSSKASRGMIIRPVDPVSAQ
jgi:hypothetical protein